VLQVWINVLEKIVGLERRGTAGLRTDGYAGVKGKKEF
jgi:hypothetical protein